MYDLQHPRTQEETEQFARKVKRPLELAPTGLDDIKDGMRGAVDLGTARRAGYDATEPILGKTGTCTDFQSPDTVVRVHRSGCARLAVVVMLTGGSTSAVRWPRVSPATSIASLRAALLRR